MTKPPRPRYARTGCVVPFCRRTSTLFPGEWVCAQHWRLVDRSLKTFRTKRLRQVRRDVDRLEGLVRHGRAMNADHAAHGKPPPWDIARTVEERARARARWHRLERATWRRMKHQAIERALGIG